MIWLFMTGISVGRVTLSGFDSTAEIPRLHFTFPWAVPALIEQNDFRFIKGVKLVDQMSSVNFPRIHSA